MENELRTIDDIANAIKNTPWASKDEVERYHGTIKKIMDSGNIVLVPSQAHRNLHQEMWLNGHGVYNGYHDSNEAFKSFGGLDANVSNNLKEIERFGAWYFQTYLLSFIKENLDLFCRGENLSPTFWWAIDTMRSADKQIYASTHKHLNEISIAI